MVELRGFEPMAIAGAVRSRAILLLADCASALTRSSPFVELGRRRPEPSELDAACGRNVESREVPLR
jgi:hypothetical protein